MIVKWKNGHKIEKGLGSQMCGLQHEGERPNEIIIEPSELLKWPAPLELIVQYIYQDLYACVKTYGSSGIVRFGGPDE